MKNIVSKFVLGAALLVATANAQVFVRIGPPAPPREVIPVRPGPRYVWTPGYQRWDGGQYRWQPGAWVVPPGAGHRWVPGHWRSTRRGYYWVEGHWR